MDIYLRSSKEVICFCEHLFNHYKQIDLEWKKDEIHGNHISLEKVEASEQLLLAISRALVAVYHSFHLSQRLKQIIKKNYYYTDRIEIERIIEQVYVLLDDPRNELSKKIKESLQNLFYERAKNEYSLYFNSMIHFQLSALQEYLIDVVGLAIDEFKREESHQEFIHNVRNFMRKKQSNFKEIHIIQGKEFTFYKESGKKLTKTDIRRLLQEEPLYILGLTTSEYNLSPLIAMAPKQIFIYGTDPFEGKTQSIMNIFQDRVTFKNIQEFPFTISREKN